MKPLTFGFVLACTAALSVPAIAQSLITFSEAREVCEKANIGALHRVPDCIRDFHRLGMRILADEFLTAEFRKRYEDAIIASITPPARK